VDSSSCQGKAHIFYTTVEQFPHCNLSYFFRLFLQQKCRLGVNRCPHPGCPEAKLIYLHLKTCTSGSGEPCPKQHKGCADARKLLAHYRRCREIRARQATNRSKTQQHVCLVCSLVARHVKGSLDSNRSTSPKSRTSRHLIPTLNLSSDGNATGRSPQPSMLVRPRSTSPMRGDRSSVVSSLPFSWEGNRSTVDSSLPFRWEGAGASTTPKKMPMPPPPPRFPFSKQQPCEKASAPEGVTGNDTIHSAVYRALHAASSDHVSNPAEESELGKSLDISGGFLRPRAESLDILPSLAWRGTRAVHDDEPMSPEMDRLEFQAPRKQGRRRSASCSVPSSQSSIGASDTIIEEPVGEELQRILEGDT
jgi:hypothetical protein